MPNRAIKQINEKRNKLIEFCRKNHIVRMGLFGSALTSEFRKTSDIDLLIDFHLLTAWRPHPSGWGGSAAPHFSCFKFFNDEKFSPWKHERSAVNF